MDETEESEDRRLFKGDARGRARRKHGRASVSPTLSYLSRSLGTKRVSSSYTDDPEERV
jgi:hypothetical protein